MDSIISTAITEICSVGITGLLITELWSRLYQSVTSSGLYLCESVKTAIWNGLLNVSGMQFRARSSVFNSLDPLIKSYKESEKLKVKLFAGEDLRDSYVGIYELKLVESGIPSDRRHVLDAVAAARINGITQNQLAKEFGKKGNAIFYIVKSLESQGLIVRQSTIIKTKEITPGAEDGLKNTALNTNLIHLYRYSKHLSCQQRVEITKEDSLDSPVNADDCFTKDDMQVKDFLPELKAICNKLEEADDQILAASDIKKSLGYQHTKGHRAWRHILKKLKDAGTVEELVESNTKVHPRLRLLKKFDPKNFTPKYAASGSNDLDADEPIQHQYRGQVSEQLLEIPIEQQIYDIINAEGSTGITLMEVCKRLGLHNKRNSGRFEKMFTKFSMPVHEDCHNRSTVKRVWTTMNFSSSSTVLENLKDELEKDEFFVPTGMDIVLHKDSDQTVRNSYGGKNQKTFERQVGVEHLGGSAEDCETSPMLMDTSTLQDSAYRSEDILHDSEIGLVNAVIESSTTLIEAPKPPSPNQYMQRTFPAYPCPPVSIPNAQRKRRILKLLEEEKFKLKAELYRALDIGKDKPTTMDRKTLIRTLNKLQQEGLCKVIQVSVPIVTNCCKKRTIDVVFNKSFQGLTEEIVDEIHEKWRSFEKKVRSGQSLSQSKNEEPLPVPSSSITTPKPQYSDAQAVRQDAWLSNGYVTGAMIRAKLLHEYLWGYLSSSFELDDTLNNSHSTCKMFSMNAVRKGMPLQLFLQVVGSTKNSEDLIQSCKRGLCLSDLPVQEYKSLMDSLARGRMTRVIDILQRLKLIRFVTGGHIEEADTLSTTLQYALELKPYIEEPELPFTVGSSSFDPRPKRYDFVLLNKREVEKYWKILEGCYATADSAAAKHAIPDAFPGCSVKEIFHVGSWSTVRVMTAEQREQLLRHVAKDDPKVDIASIAEDLDLTITQVHRAFNDKRKRIDRIQRDLIPEKESQPQSSNSTSVSGRKDKYMTEHSRKRAKVDGASQVSENRCISKVIDCDDQYNGELNCSLANYKPQSCDERNYAENAKVSGSSEEDEEDNHDFISRCAFSKLRPARRSKFSWTEASERQLVVKYARQRAILGPQINRVDWVSVPDLPAPPMTCKRRMAALRRDRNIRRAVMRLCNLLTGRRKHLNRSHEKEPLDQNLLKGGHLNKISSPSSLENLVDDIQAQQWDDFGDKDLKLALNEVFRWKRLAKREASNRAEPIIEKVTQDQAEGEELQNINGKRQHKSSSRRLPKKFLRLLNEDISVSRQTSETLAVANCVELLKLVFLSNPMSPHAPNMAIDTLQQYSEKVIFTAFNFLREKKFMVGGSDSQPFVLSQHFLRSLSSSPFPPNTRQRAIYFTNWLSEQENDLMKHGIYLDADLQCGDIFHLFALVSSGDLVISPCLPDEGIGETENVSKIYRDGECISRREKGFPGIKVSVTRASICTSAAVESLKKDEYHASQHFSQINSSHSFCSAVLVEDDSDNSIWKSMSKYSEYLLSPSFNYEMAGILHPELFEAVCSTVSKAGDQGVNMSEVCKVTGESIAEHVVDILQLYGFVVKVNAFSNIRVVCAKHRSKYFLTTMKENCQQILKLDPSTRSLGYNKYPEISTGLSEEASEISGEAKAAKSSTVENYLGADVSSKWTNLSCMPILPWLNVDGTMNLVVYEGLTHRVLGIVMQNPGIPEENLIHRMNVLNPQSCRTLLELMILDGNLILKNMHQTTSTSPPEILGFLFPRSLEQSAQRNRKHFFANPNRIFAM